MNTRGKIYDQLKSGLELSAAEIQKAIGVSSGTLYPVLHRMEEEGLVESRWEHPDGLFPRRRLYRAEP